MIQPESTNNQYRGIKTLLLTLSLIAVVFLLIIMNVLDASKYMRKACDAEIESLISSIDGSEDCVMIHLADGGKKNLVVLHSPDKESCYIKDSVEVGFLNEEQDLLEIYRLEDGRYTKDSEQCQSSLFDTFQIKQNLDKYVGIKTKFGAVDKENDMLEATLDSGAMISGHYYEDGARLQIKDDNSYTFISKGDEATSWLSTAAALYLDNVEDTAIHDRLFKCFIDFGATREKSRTAGVNQNGGYDFTNEDKNLINDSIEQCSGDFIALSNRNDLIIMDGRTAVWIYLDDNEVRTRVIEKAYMKELDTGADTERVDNSIDSMQEEYLFEATKFMGSLKTLNYIPLEDEPGDYGTELGFTLSVDADTLEIEFNDLFAHIDYKIIQDKTEAQTLLGDNLIQRYYKALKSSDTEIDSLLDLYEETFIN